MTAIRKRRAPANDERSGRPQKMPYVVLAKPASKKQKAAASSVLVLFALLLGLSAIPSLPTKQNQSPMSAEAPLEEKGLFDIVLDEENSFYDDPQTQLNESPSGVQVVVEEAAGIFIAAPGEEEQAEIQASTARKYFRQGKIKQAILFQRRAVELSPLDMTYRLALSIMHDHASDKKGAAMLYRQVVKAHKNNDDTLPPDMDIKAIQARLDYLSVIISPVASR